MEIGKNICMLRTAKGLSQSDLARIIGVSELAIQSYEAEKWRPGMSMVVRLAETLQVNVAELVGNCKEVSDENGDIILVEKDSGNRLLILGKFKYNTI